MSKGSEAPKPARKVNVVVKALTDGEVLVYDLERHRAHSLNPTAAAVWRQCDGQRSLTEIAALVARDVASPVDDRLVTQALSQLAKARLLDNPGVWVSPMTRRQALRAGLATAAALPLVTSVTVPRTTEAQSACLVPTGACIGPFGCGPSAPCAEGVCCVIVGGGQQTCCANP